MVLESSVFKQRVIKFFLRFKHFKRYKKLILSRLLIVIGFSHLFLYLEANSSVVNTLFSINLKLFDLTNKHQISGTTIGTKFGPLYACIFSYCIEQEILKSEQVQHLVSRPWHIGSFFSICISREKEFEKFLIWVHVFSN